MKIWDRKLSNGMNVTENKLYEAMKQIGLNPKPQYPISDMHVDFCFPEHKLVIEVNGPHHKQEWYAKKDKKRLFVLNDMGYSRRTVQANKVYENPDVVALRIKKMVDKIKGSESIPEDNTIKTYGYDSSKYYVHESNLHPSTRTYGDNDDEEAWIDGYTLLIIAGILFFAWLFW